LTFTRKTRNRLIAELLGLATKDLLRSVRGDAFRDTHVKRRLFKLKGRGPVARGESLATFARTLTGPIVNAFWRGRRCLYVGKGLRPTRLISHRKSYGREADSVEVFCVRSRSYLPKAECLATHLFEPRDLAVRPARAAWGEKWPVCVRHDQVRH